MERGRKAEIENQRSCSAGTVWEIYGVLDMTDEGHLRVFLAESSTKSEEMSSSTPTSFLAMQV